MGPHDLLLQDLSDSKELCRCLGLNRQQFIVDVFSDVHASLCFIRPEGFLQSNVFSELFNYLDQIKCPFIYIDLTVCPKVITIPDFTGYLNSVINEHCVKYNICIEKESCIPLTEPDQRLLQLIESLNTSQKKKCYFIVNGVDRPKNWLRNEVDNYFQLQSRWTAILAKITKGNNSVKKSILVGLGRPGEAHVDGALNNYRLFTSSDSQFNSVFGFTASDLKNIQQALQLNRQEIVNINTWYGGYYFGEETLYNPTSVLRYLADIAQHREVEAKKRKMDVSQYIVSTFYTSPPPKPNWDINLNDSYLRDIILSDKIKSLLSILFNKQVLTIFFVDTATYYAGVEKSGSTHELLSILVNAGLLTAQPKGGKGKYIVQIPNQEVSCILQSLMQQNSNLYAFFNEKKTEKSFSSLTVNAKRLYLLKAMEKLIYDNKKLFTLISGMLSEEQNLDAAYELLQEQTLIINNP